MVELKYRRKDPAVSIKRKGSERAISRLGRFSKAYGDFTRAFDLRELNINPDDVFADVRGR